MANVSEVTARDFERRVLKAERPVVVDFYADWCAPCRRMSPVIERLASELEGEVEFVKLDIDRAPDLAAAYRVSSIPALLRFEGGRPTAWSVGARPGHVVSRELKLPSPGGDGSAPPKPRFRLFARRRST